MQLNRRHKVGLFLIIIIVGTGLVLDAGVKESVGIGLLGLAATWLIGSVRLKRKETSQIPETPAAAQVPEQALTPKEGQHTETSHAAVRPSHGGSWAWMIVSILIFLVLLGLAIFNMTWQSMAGEAERAGESLGKMLIPLIVLGFAARRTWNSLLSKEPEDNPAYKSRHRRFNAIVGTCSIALLLAALGFGVIAGNRIAKNKRLDATFSEIKKLSPKGAELRAQIKTIMSEETPTFQDYYLRSLKLEGVLDEYYTQQQRLRPLMDATLAEMADQPKEAESIRTVQRINDKDAEVVKLFRLEIAKSKELMTLPASRQTNFYRQEIVPLEQKAARIANEEIGMMREAQQAGIKWPSDVKELLKPN
jgi:uncharacterized integral membrane protein